MRANRSPRSTEGTAVQYQPEQVDYTQQSARGSARVTTKFALRSHARSMYRVVLGPPCSPRPNPPSSTSVSRRTHIDRGFELPREVVPLPAASHRDQHRGRLLPRVSAHPGVTFVQTTGDRLPFDDQPVRHRVLVSAVIEHAGDRSQQRQFLAELPRVARAVLPDDAGQAASPSSCTRFCPSCTGFPSASTRRPAPHGRQGHLGLDGEPEPAGRAVPPRAVSLARRSHRGAERRLLGMRSNLVAFGSSPA